jgi:prepilin-type N-terminal cleavage/methylation domain-containing protein
MYSRSNNCDQGFSLVELMISLIITLVILGAAVAVFSGALSTRARESGKTDAITSAQAALSVMSREIGNSGYGLSNNGLVLADCSTSALRYRANVDNTNNATTESGEDVTYLFDATSQSVVRYDRNTGITSGIINRVSNVAFSYQNYVNVGTVPVGPSTSTGKVTIALTVNLENVQGQPQNQTVTLTSDITLRNSPYMLGQY